MTDQIKSFGNEVAAAEARLLAARKNMTKAAERLGLPTAGIFSESNFVLRTTAGRWADRAERDGRHEGIKWGWLTALKVERSTSEYSFLRGVKLGLDGPATSAAHAMVRALIAAHKERRGEKSEPAPRDPKPTPQSKRKLLT